MLNMTICRNRQAAAAQVLEAYENLHCCRVSFAALASLLNEMDPMAIFTPYAVERRQENGHVFDVVTWDGEVLLDREVRE